MKNENYNCSISANITANEAFKDICKPIRMVGPY